LVDLMVSPSTEPSRSVLDPIDRISELLFGVIMALTFTCTLAVATADNIQVRTMLIGALGCNLAWGVIDGAVFLMARLTERGRAVVNVRALQQTTDAAAAQRLIAEVLPAPLAPAILPQQLEAIWRELRALPSPQRPNLTKADGLAAMAICLLSFLSTFPIVIPFLLITDAWTALRVSNLVAIVMLYLCGHLLADWAGFRPWAAGLWLVVGGLALVGVAIALGG
jgi:VIT1/CCC1 family predicted Fe2+/Mn2+ transporter